MSTPVETQKIVTALLAFQKLGIVVTKDGVNPAFHSAYMQLDDVLEAVQGPLAKLGVVILQLPGEHGLLTRLVSVEDNSSVESFIPYTDTTTAQKLGGCITYARRYSLVTMLGIGDSDDDGETASQTSQASQLGTTPVRSQPTQARPQARPANGLPLEGQISQVELSISVVTPKGMTAKGNPYWSVETDSGKMTSFYELEEGQSYLATVKGGSYNSRPTYTITEASLTNPF